MIQLFIDLETIPTGEPLTEEQVTIDGRLKDPTKIQMAIEEAIAKEYRSRSLKPYKGRIFCISLIERIKGEVGTEDKMNKIMIQEPSNEETIKMFWDTLRNTLSTKQLLEGIFIGFNISKFDLWWLSLYTRKYAKQNINFLPSPRSRQGIIDLMTEFTYGLYNEYISFKEACKFFGIEVKTKMDGSEVYDYYLKGKYTEICNYCEEDNLANIKLYDRLIG
jgi:predicted PolB exonuclease-like 3'-5' exonuclease